MARHKQRRRTGPATALAAAGALAGAVLIRAVVVAGTSGPGKEHTTWAGVEGERVESARPSGVSSSSSHPAPSASPTGLPSAAPTAPPTARAALEPVLEPVPGTGARVGRGPLSRHSVAVPRGLPVDAAAFAAAVERTLSDRRSWTADGTVALQRQPPAQAGFRVALASPAFVEKLRRPLNTAATRRQLSRKPGWQQHGGGWGPLAPARPWLHCDRGC